MSHPGLGVIMTGRHVDSMPQTVFTLYDFMGLVIITGLFRFALQCCIGSGVGDQRGRPTQPLKT